MKSWIQDHALQRLLRSESVPLKEIIPDGVEPNLFSYHLKQLIADKYVESPSRGIYALTAQGHAHVENLSTKTLRSAPSPKSVILFYAKNDDKLLFWRWSRQPYIGKVTFPHTRISVNQDVSEALSAALEEKLNLPPDTSAAFRVTGMVRIYTDNVLVSHMNAYVYELNPDELTLPFVGRNGSAFWSSVDDLASDDLMSDYEQLIGAVEHPQDAPFDIQLSY